LNVFIVPFQFEMSPRSVNILLWDTCVQTLLLVGVLLISEHFKANMLVLYAY